MSNKLRAALALLLVAVLLFTLPSCSKYREEMATDEENRLVMTVGGNPIYFDLLSFFYHGSSADTHEGKLQEAVANIAEVYAIFSVANERGFAPFGEEMNEELDDAVREAIDGYDTRREYIAALKKNRMSDRVCRLLLRASLAEAHLLSQDEGGLAVTNEELLAFCEGESVVRVLSLIVYYDASILTWAQGRAQEIKTALAEGDGTDAAFLAVAHSLASGESEHTYLSLSQWNRLCGTNETSLTVGQESDALFSNDNFVMMRVAEKDLAYAEAHLSELLSSFMNNQISERAAALQDAATFSSLFSALRAEDFA